MSGLTRKHMERLAKILADSKDDLHRRDQNYVETPAWKSIYRIEEDITNMLADENPRFDRERFKAAAAGVTSKC